MVKICSFFLQTTTTYCEGLPNKRAIQKVMQETFHNICKRQIFLKHCQRHSGHDEPESSVNLLHKKSAITILGNILPPIAKLQFGFNEKYHKEYIACFYPCF